MLQLVLPAWQGNQEQRKLVFSNAEPLFCMFRAGISVLTGSLLLTAILSLIISPLSTQPTLSVLCMLYVNSQCHIPLLSRLLTWVFSYCSMCSCSPILFLRLKTFGELLVFQLHCQNHISVILWLLSISVCPLRFSGLLFLLARGTDVVITLWFSSVTNSPSVCLVRAIAITPTCSFFLVSSMF